MRLLSALLVLAFATSAKAEWRVRAPAESCVSADVLAARLEGMVTHDQLGAGPRRTLRAVLDEVGGTVTIVVAEGGRPIGERQLAIPGADCAALTEAALFVLVTIIEGGMIGTFEPSPIELPEGEPSVALAMAEEPSAPAVPDEASLWQGPRPEAPRVAAPRARGRGFLALGLDGASERVPRTGVGPRLTLGWARAAAAVTVSAVYRRGASRADDGTVQLDLVDAAVRAHLRLPVHHWVTLELGVGPLVSFGRARGRDFAQSRSAPVFGVGAGVELGVGIGRGAWSLRMGGAIDGWWRRERLTVVGGVTRSVFEQSPVSARGFLELGLWIGRH